MNVLKSDHRVLMLNFDFCTENAVSIRSTKMPSIQYDVIDYRGESDVIMDIYLFIRRQYFPYIGAHRE